MLGLSIELALVAALFLWLYRRQLRDRAHARRVPPTQMKLELDEEG